jgi:hypothetical protein
MLRNCSTPKVVFTLKHKVQSVRADSQLSNLTTALNALGCHIANFDATRKLGGGYEVRVFKSDAESHVLAIADNNGFSVAHTQRY